MTFERAHVRLVIALVIALIGGCEDAVVQMAADATTMTDAGAPDAMDASGDAADATADAGDERDTDPALDAGPLDLGPVDLGADAGPIVPVEPMAPIPATGPARPVIPWVGTADETSLVASAPPDLLMPCPWRVAPPIAGGDPFSTCEPWPTAGADLTCAAGTTHFPGESGCTRVGNACASMWPTAPAGAVRYVDAAAAAGGDGSMAQPFATITEALTSPPSGSLAVLIAAGTYAETISRPGGNVTLIGVCAERTRIGGTSTAGALRSMAGTTNVRDLTIEGIDVAGGTVVLDGVVLDGTGLPAAIVAPLHATGGTLTASNVHVHHGTIGVSLSSGARATIDRVVVEDTTDAGIDISGLTTELSLGRASIRDTGSTGIRNGSSAAVGGAVTMRSVVVERASVDGIRSWGAGSTIDGEDVVVRDTRFTPSDGFGVNVRRNASIVLRRLLAERNRERGVHAGEGAIELHGAAIRDTSAAADGTGGMGAQVYFANQAVFDRVYVARSATAGILVEGDGTTLRANDVVVRDVRLTSSEPFAGALVVRGGSLDGSRVLLAGGRGRTLGVALNPDAMDDVAPHVLLQDVILSEADTIGGEAPATIDIAHGTATLRRALVRAGVGDGANATSSPPADASVSLLIEDGTFEGTDGSRTGVRALGAPAIVVLRRMAMTGYQSAATSRDGASLTIEDLTAADVTWGLRCRAGSTIGVERASITGFATAAILSGDIGSRVTGSDIVVGPPSPSMEPTASLAALERASIELDRVHVMGARNIAVGAFGFSASVTLRDARVEGTTAGDDGAASSVGAYASGVVSIDTFVLSDGGRCGVQVADSGGADLVRGEVRGHDFGACVYPGFSEPRVTAFVLYTENDAPLSRAMEPVPVMPSTGP